MLSGYYTVCSGISKLHAYIASTNPQIIYDFMNVLVCRSYENPNPEYRLVADHASLLVDNIHKSLRLGVDRMCRFTLEFRTDVFTFLFRGKGRKPPSGQGLFYELQDFDLLYFPEHWFRVYDKLGSGCQIDFPIRLQSKIKWVPVVYDKKPDGSLVVKNRSFVEVVVVTLVKKHCL